VKPDLLIARQGIKLKFNDFQQTTQEHVWPRLNKDDLIATAKRHGKSDGVGEGEAGGIARHAAGSAVRATAGIGIVKKPGALRLPGLRFSPSLWERAIT
jgi:hypothetical protein